MHHFVDRVERRTVAVLSVLQMLLASPCLVEDPLEESRNRDVDFQLNFLSLSDKLVMQARPKQVCYGVLRSFSYPLSVTR